MSIVVANMILESIKKRKKRQQTIQLSISGRILRPQSTKTILLIGQSPNPRVSYSSPDPSRIPRT
jgi:hypothetical protein